METLVRERVADCEALTEREDREFADQCATVLGYQGVAKHQRKERHKAEFLRALHELDIRPFSLESIRAYKKKQELEMNMHLQIQLMNLN